MRFGPVPLDEAEGAVLAHSLRLGSLTLKKGRRLSTADLADVREAGLTEVTAAVLDRDDVAEDTAAARVAAYLSSSASAQISAPFTGRVNLFADSAGIVAIDTDLVDRLNRIDEAITVATLNDMARVHPRQMLATVKIIPYAAPEAAVAQAERLLARAASDGTCLVSHHPFAALRASLVLTQTRGMADRLVHKGAKAVRDRVISLGMTMADEQTVAHDTAAIGAAIGAASGDIILILTGSATSDRLDVGPAGLIAAGGTMTRFGMPVDPGNLLFLGGLDGRPVVGLPGCARSPKLNGADWVLERLAAGLDVADTTIAAMGVGGLLKEIPSRPNPRAGGGEAPRRPVIAVLLLAAGRSTRMEGRDKLLEQVSGHPLLRRAAETVIASGADETVVVVREGEPGREDALSGLTVSRVVNPRADEGMGTSLAAGIRSLGPEVDGALILMADMPEITSVDLDRVIAAFDPG
ncbi:MAG: molybdopterin-binding/glycosyltransferase family 2 protein, partial [Pseudomonadota bacterium]